MARQPEAYLKDRLRAKIRERWPKAIVHKLSDRFTAGMPDLLVINAVQGVAVTLGLEVKTERGKQTAIQRVEEMAWTYFSPRVGIIRYEIVRSVRELTDLMDIVEVQCEVQGT